MKKIAIIIALVVFAALSACGEKEEAVSLKVNFIRDYAKGMTIAGEQNKPVMLVFDATWCGWCKKLKKDVFSKEQVGEASKRMVNILVDIDQDQATANKYNVRGVPAVFFMSPDGSQVMPYQGPRDSASFIKIMNSFADKFGKA